MANHNFIKNLIMFSYLSLHLVFFSFQCSSVVNELRSPSIGIWESHSCSPARFLFRKFCHILLVGSQRVKKSLTLGVSPLISTRSANPVDPRGRRNRCPYFFPVPFLNRLESSDVRFVATLALYQSWVSEVLVRCSEKITFPTSPNKLR